MENNFLSVDSFATDGRDQNKCEGFIYFEDIPQNAVLDILPKKLERLGSPVDLKKCVGFEDDGKRKSVWIAGKALHWVRWEAPYPLVLPAYKVLTTNILQEEPFLPVLQRFEVSCRKVAEIVAAMILREVPQEYIINMILGAEAYLDMCRERMKALRA